ncbi:hypothetical protein KY308_02485 [Candidatus Woesearchaeota archaeon]|nr:hypothetical protein [Candidatus Woesearchaeota archaeon]
MAVNLIGTYDVHGHYRFHATTGDHEGQISHFSDGKLVGKIRDNNNDGCVPIYTKYILGFTPENKEFLFLKLYPGGRLPAVAWVMSFSKKDGNDIILSGNWSFTRSEDISILEDALLLSFEEEREELLSKVPVSRINKIFSEDLVALAKKKEWNSGTLVLKI